MRQAVYVPPHEDWVDTFTAKLRERVSLRRTLEVSPALYDPDHVEPEVAPEERGKVLTLGAYLIGFTGCVLFWGGLARFLLGLGQ